MGKGVSNVFNDKQEAIKLLNSLPEETLRDRNAVKVLIKEKSYKFTTPLGGT